MLYFRNLAHWKLDGKIVQSPKKIPVYECQEGVKTFPNCKANINQLRQIEDIWFNSKHSYNRQKSGV